MVLGRIQTSTHECGRSRRGVFFVVVSTEDEGHFTDTVQIFVRTYTFDHCEREFHRMRETVHLCICASLDAQMNM